jgi:phytoene desaturase
MVMDKNPVNQYDVIVVGAGIAGLTCGATLAKKGYKTIVIEMNEIPGGYCTSFKRKGYTFDAAVHYNQGARDNGWLNLILRYLGVEGELEFRRLDPLYRLVYPNESMTIPADLKEYISMLSDKFPEEKEGISKLFDTIIKTQENLLRLPITFNLLNLALFPLRFPLIFKYSKMTFDEMMSQYINDPRLKSIISSGWLCVGLPPSKVSAFLMSGYIYGAHVLGCYYPKGGMQSLPNVLASALSRYGGILQLGMEVTEILVENGKAVGVQTRDGNRIYAKSIVSNIDAMHTFFDLVGKEKLSEKFVKRLEMMEPSISFFQVWLGIDKHPKEEGINESELTYYCSYNNDQVYDKLFQGGFKEAYICALPSLLDATLAPSGHHIINILYPASYEFERKWKIIDGKRGDDYRSLKEKVKNKIIGTVESIMPWISEHTIITEAATPITLERYTRNYKGAAYGWAHSLDQSGINRLQPNTPIKGLYLAGNWTVPGVSTAIAAVSGIRTAELIGHRH